jgi:hypothetical protein
MNCYEAVCIKEIYWKGKTYVSGDKIKILEPAMHTLFSAGVIGAMKKIPNELECAVKEAPENAMKPHGIFRGKKAER